MVMKYILCVGLIYKSLKQFQLIIIDVLKHFIYIISILILPVHFQLVKLNPMNFIKLQTKKGLIHTHRHHLHKIDYEKKAFSLLQHPFIVNMDYAFHTDSLAIMVLGLSTGGDLKQCLASYDPKRMPISRVRFYAAEI